MTDVSTVKQIFTICQSEKEVNSLVTALCASRLPRAIYPF